VDLIKINQETYLTHRSVLAIGNFDGVHLGHKQLISEAVSKARQKGITSAVLTFRPHPRQVLVPDDSPALLTDDDLKRALISRLEPDMLLEIPFTSQFSKVSPERFVEEYLVSRFKVAAVFIGYNYSFGAMGKGTSKMLEQLGQYYGFSVFTIPPVKVDGHVVSSSLVRDQLINGDVQQANEYLGHPYIIKGIVKDGEKMGRKIGFPTANIDTDRMQVIIPSGVYMVRAYCSDIIRTGVMNIGNCPTFDRDKVSVEVHLLDFEGDLYGQIMEVEVLQRLRGERAFSGVDQLVRQIGKDISQVRQVIKDNVTLLDNGC